ncbi:hypothetical protein CBG55_00760 [Prevotella intermedia]|uniref:MORN repeat protein n=1 Tax=Prevotella intermedia TaxID=28131 RepID=A0A2M8TL93_PREIN|nr:hypothetical protein [Prevotella intermedia]OWP32796.1 hypothetical protein CBG55_00760 [Prevotella intermedia]PJI24707.1 hypothetical protein CTM59_00775 [Prevotella intermedia]
MRRLFFFFALLLLPFSVLAQLGAKHHIPKGAIFYNRNWKGVSTAKQAAYYRLLTVDKRGRKIFRDYYISGQLCAEKHYISVNRADDKQTVLTGVARTFYKSGRVESIMQYSNGKADGRAVSFFANGNVGMKLNYAKGLLNGASYTYSEYGNLEYTTVWNNGTKVKEYMGGTDKYIDKATGKDAFVESHRADEKLVMEQSHAVTNGSTQKAVQANKSKLQSKSMAASPTPFIDAAKTMKKTNSKSEFKFAFLYDLLINDDQRTNEMSFFDGIGAAHGLTLAQVIKGNGMYKELSYSYNMQYDERAGRDVVTGKHPRQMGFWGAGKGTRFTMQRINLYTWSEEEMLQLAEDALSYGYEVLGGGDYRTMNGNFVLKHSEYNKAGDSFFSVISFTHLDSVYANLYHIAFEIK